MLTERFSNPHLEDRPLSFIGDRIHAIFDGGEVLWYLLEPEVILSKLQEMGEDITTRLVAKIKILRYILDFGVEGLLDDPIRTVYAVEILNNEDSISDNPEFVPYVGSLELAYFLEQMKELGLKDGEVPYEFTKVCSYVLSNEGYYEPVFPFTFLKKKDLYPTYMQRQIPETDSEIHQNKAKGVKMYLELMNKLGAK